MRLALERRRAGKLVLRFMRLVHSRSGWKRMGILLKNLLALARQEKEFGRTTQAMIAHLLAPLQKQLGVQLAPQLHNPASPCLAALAPSPSGTLSISRSHRRQARREAAGFGSAAKPSIACTTPLKTPIRFLKSRQGDVVGLGCFSTASALYTPALYTPAPNCKRGLLDDVLTPLPCSSKAVFGASGCSRQAPCLTPRDLAVIFCNLRNLNDISSELVLSVVATLHDLPRINLSQILGTFDVLLAGLCRYMCNFPQAMEALVSARQDKAHSLWFSQVPRARGSAFDMAFMCVLTMTSHE